MKYIVNKSLEMEGTCTAEHGVGVRKKKYLKKELGENAVEFMGGLKKFVDPKNIMNPGKVVDP